MTPLSMSPEEMRLLGHRVVDAMVEHYATVSQKPAIRRGSSRELEHFWREPMPVRPSDPFEVLDVVLGQVFTSIGMLNHPRHFAFIPSPGNFVSVMADALVSAYTPFAGVWHSGSGCAAIELAVLEWLKQALGMPAGAGGLLQSGGSLANLTAMGAAREAQGEVAGQVIYTSDQTHSSIDRAARILAYRANQLRKLESDSRYCLTLASLRAAVEADRAAGLRPSIVVANAGTTNTGAIDPLPELAEYCREQGMWLHVDGAYGASAALSARGRALLEGIGEADSVSLDPHKWLFQPFGLGCVLVRDVETLTRVYSVLPEYLRDTATRAGETNFCDLGPELTRPFRALKLWMSLKVFGADEFGRAIDGGFALAEAAEAMLRQDPRWEVVTPAQMAIVCFRYAVPGMPEEDLDRLNHDMAVAATADGYAFLSTTVLRGRTVLRLCTIHPAATEADVEETLRRLASYATDSTAQPGNVAG